jgi:hypothetical protein
MNCRLLPIAALITACGGPAYNYECHIAELEGFFSSTEVDCDRMRTNVLQAEALFIDHRIASPVDVQAVFAHTRLEVFPELCVNGIADAERTNHCLLGRTFLDGHVWLGSTVAGFAHEMLHRMDNTADAPSAVLDEWLHGHDGWPPEYWETEAQYRKTFLEVRMDHLPH